MSIIIDTWGNLANLNAVGNMTEKTVTVGDLKRQSLRQEKVVVGEREMHHTTLKQETPVSFPSVLLYFPHTNQLIFVPNLYTVVFAPKCKKVVAPHLVM